MTALDSDLREVVNQAGFKPGYDKCLIATRSTLVLPLIEGIGSERVFYMRTVEDAIKLKKAMENNSQSADNRDLYGGRKLTELIYDAGLKFCPADAADR